MGGTSPHLQTQTQTQKPHGSSFYMRFEVGLTWNPRGGEPKSHQLTISSKSARQRANQFPRQLPSATTNYLSEPAPVLPSEYSQWQQGSHGPHHHSQMVGWYRSADAHGQPSTTAATDHHYQAGLIDNLSSLQPRQPHVPCPDDTDARSRTYSRSSHDRGRSAPPPLNDSPWDAEPEPMSATALPSVGNRGRDVCKPLPATPAQSGPSRGIGSVDDRARGRAKEMESLASALMTVDNGFEDQWWYQGDRLVNINGELLSPSVLRSMDLHAGTAGWAVAEGSRVSDLPREAIQINSSSSSMVDIVSPLTDSLSPAASFRSLKRTMTTRSDELHM